MGAIELPMMINSTSCLFRSFIAAKTSAKPFRCVMEPAKSTRSLSESEDRA